MSRALLPLVLIAALALAGCERIAPVRTLPNWVQGVYVPMVKNSSFEPGIEEDATRRIQEAFLQDGRVTVAPKSTADLIVRVEILQWTPRSDGTSGDDITDRMEYVVDARVQLFEPYAEQPLAVLPIRVTARFNVDARSIDYDQLPDRIDSLLQQVANTIVQQTLTGFPAVAR